MAEEQVNFEKELCELRARISYLEGIVEQIIEQVEAEENELFGEEEGILPEGDGEEDIPCDSTSSTSSAGVHNYRSRYSRGSGTYEY